MPTGAEIHVLHVTHATHEMHEHPAGRSSTIRLHRCTRVIPVVAIILCACNVALGRHTRCFILAFSGFMGRDALARRKVAFRTCLCLNISRLANAIFMTTNTTDYFSIVGLQTCWMVIMLFPFITGINIGINNSVTVHTVTLFIYILVCTACIR